MVINNKNTLCGGKFPKVTFSGALSLAVLLFSNNCIIMTLAVHLVRLTVFTIAAINIFISTKAHDRVHVKGLLVEMSPHTIITSQHHSAFRCLSFHCFHFTAHNLTASVCSLLSPAVSATCPATTSRQLPGCSPAGHHKSTRSWWASSKRATYFYQE